jgi:hypothetical protein
MRVTISKVEILHNMGSKPGGKGPVFFILSKLYLGQK